jgi:hypothetical protein
MACFNPCILYFKIYVSVLDQKVSNFYEKTWQKSLFAGLIFRIILKGI